MDANTEICLGLGLGLTQSYPNKEISPKKNNKRLLFLDLSIPHTHPPYDQFSNGSKDDDDVNFSMNISRKKLRLTRDQTTLLEDSFKQHTTLNTAQKHTLAEKLNLKPRQVEVWFQNRRARTKLKQTEVECEFLKKNCERLSDENRRLKKELLELRSSVKVDKAPAGTSFFHHNNMGTGEKKGQVGGVAKRLQEA